MAIALATASGNANSTVTFDFGNVTVLNYVVGISYWNFDFPSHDYQVETVTMSLQSNSSGGIVTTRITGDMVHKDDHISNGLSPVTLSCLAVVTSANSLVTLGNARGIDNGKRSDPITLCSNTPGIDQALLAGFNLGYPGGGHYIRDFQIGAGCENNAYTGYITGQAMMDDNSGNSASTETIDGGLVYVDASASGSNGVLVAKTLITQSSNAFDVDMGCPLKNAAVFLQSMTATYGRKTDHQVKIIGGGTPSWTVNGSVVKLASGMAFMSDNSGNHQDNSLSSASLLILGIPA